MTRVHSPQALSHALSLVTSLPSPSVPGSGLDQLPLAPPASSLGSPLPSRIWPWLPHVFLSCCPATFGGFYPRGHCGLRKQVELSSSLSRLEEGAAPCSQPGQDRAPGLPWGSRDSHLYVTLPATDEYWGHGYGVGSWFCPAEGFVSSEASVGGGQGKRVLRPERPAGRGASQTVRAAPAPGPLTPRCPRTRCPRSQLRVS